MTASTTHSYRPFLSQRVSPDIRQLLADKERLLSAVRELAPHRFRDALTVTGAELGAAGSATLAARLGRSRVFVRRG